MKHTDLVLLMLVISLLALTSCDGFTTIRGYVRDKTGKPIEGARVILKSDSRVYQDETTPKDGSYLLDTTNEPFKFQMKLVVSKDGYETFEKSFESCQRCEQDVVLDPVQ